MDKKLSEIMRALKIFSILLTSITLLFFLSCKKNIEDKPSGNQGSPASDSMTLLKATGGGGFIYDNDSLPSKFYSVSPVVGGPQFDTVFIYYNSERKVNKLIRVGKESGFGGRGFKDCYLTVFNQGRISKIYQKGVVYDDNPTYYDPTYTTSIGSITSDNIFRYDSLVYDVTGRLIKKYNFWANNYPLPGYPFNLYHYELLDYYNPVTLTDNYLYSVKLYTDSAGTGIFYNSDKIYFFEVESGKVNPLYKTFKELALFSDVYNIFSYFPRTTSMSISGWIDKYSTLLPCPIKKVNVRTITAGISWQTYDFQNVYDADNNLTSSSYGSALLGYNYIRVKK